MGLNFGDGPTQFVIEPSTKQDPSYFDLGTLIGALGDFLNVEALSNLQNLKASVPWPWNKIFDIAIRPRFVVSIAKSSASAQEASGFQCVLSLYFRDSQGNYQYGVKFPDFGLEGSGAFQIEPSFTVYDLIIGYRAGDGLALSARVVFDEISGAKALLPIDLGEDDVPGKTEIVRFPFSNPSPPTPAFRLNYLGLGQRFGPDADLTAPDPITKIFDDLEANLVSNSPETVLNTLVQDYYKPDRDWFVAADLDVRGWRLRAIFNDPALYGLQITCNADQFKGLLFEILYQKLGPGLGVFYAALSLPEAYRQIQLGVVSLTIPSFKIWIYTNGDFKIAVGWPLGPNSLGIQVYVFTGGAGFYFAKLRSGDNPNNAGQIQYNPILALGLALWFGLGRSIQKGVLSAELSVTLQGTFQGILAWKANTDGESQGISRTPDYFWFAATVGIVGVLQGSVDLKIISASVLVRISATASIAFETDYGTEVTVSADVSVQVTIKILFIKISASFSATISASFTISSSPNGFASVNGPQNPAFSGIVPSRNVLALPSPRRVLVVPAPSAFTVDLRLLLQPAGVYGSTGAALQAVAGLLIPNSDDAGQPQDFLHLCEAVAIWLLNTYSPEEGSWTVVAGILGDDGDGAPADFDTKLNDFLIQYATFTLSGIDLTDPGQEDLAVSVFPMFSELQMLPSTYKDPILFSSCVTPPDYAQRVADYFAQLSISGLMSNSESSAETKKGVQDGDSTLTGMLFFDYFLLVSRALAGDLSAAASASIGTAEDGPAMPDAAMAVKVGALATRYMLNGLQLPDPAQSPPPVTPYDDRLVSAYVLTGQQFALDDTLASISVVLSVADPEGLGKTIKFAGEGTPTSIVSTMEVKPLPAEPTPQWSATTVLHALQSAILDIHLDQLAGATAQPAWYAARRPIPWTRPGTPNAYLLPIPPPLTAAAQQQPGQLTPLLQLQNPEAPSSSPAADVPHVPALFIPIRLTRVAVPQSLNVDQEGTPVPAFIPNIYQITGTDDATRELIHLALQDPGLSHVNLSLLYDAPPNGYASDVIMGSPETHHAMLFKTNLSTISQPGSDTVPLLMVHTEFAEDLGPMSASIDEAADFLKLLWEVSVVHLNGFCLYYADKDGKGLSDALFGANNGGDQALVGDGYANLVVMVEFAPAAPLQPYHNYLSVTAGSPITDTLYLGAQEGQTPLVRYDPSYPAGCVGFDISWDLQTAALASDSEGLGEIYDEAWIEQLYHLIQFQVQPSAGSPDFQGSLWSSPLSPTGSSDDDQHQTYRQVVPVYQFAGSDVDLNRNVYAAIGGTPNLEFRLADIFGNVLTNQTYTTPLPVLYNDRLVSVAEWPGVTADYSFALDGSVPTFFLNVDFDSSGIVQTNSAFLSAYNVHGRPLGRGTDDDKIEQQIRIALFKYRTIVDQLSDVNTALAVTTTVLPSNGGELGSGAEIKAQLLAFAQKIVTTLQGFLVELPPQPVRDSLPLSVSVDIADVQKRTDNIFPVEVSITMTRPDALVDPSALANVPEASVKQFLVKPNLIAPSPDANSEDPSPISDLLPFAQNFEAAFKGFGGEGSQLKVAVRTGLDPAISGTDAPSLWAMRWSADYGIQASLNQSEVAYFSLAPLNNQLMGGTANVPSYDENLNPTYAPQQFSDVDLDGWAQAFLEAVDNLLSPSVAAAIAAQTDEPVEYSYATLMGYKASLAQAVAKGLVPVFTEVAVGDAPVVRSIVPGDLQRAQDRLEQSLLGALSTTFSSATVVQVPADITVAGNADALDTEYAPRLFGGIVDTQGGGETKQYSVTNGILQMKPTEVEPQYMTFVVTAKDPGSQAALTLTPSWSAGFCEYLFESAEEEYDYLPSSWLKFVVQQDTPLNQPLGPLVVPILLRQFPPTPILLGQSAAGLEATESIAASVGEIPNPIPDVLNWKYSVQLHQSLAAQDDLWVETTYNLPIASPQGAVHVANRSFGIADYEGDPTGLFQALAQFSVAYQTLGPMVAQLPGKVFSGQGDGPSASQITKAILDEVNNVTAHWGAFRGITTRSGELAYPVSYRFSTRQEFLKNIEVDTVSYQYVVQELDAKTWQVFGNSEDVPFPTINGQGPLSPPVPVDPGPSAEGKWYVTKIAQSGPTDEFDFKWQPLNLLNYQTATSQAWIVRNDDVSQGQSSGGHLQTNPDLVYQTASANFASPILPSIVARKIAPWEPGETLSYYLRQTLLPLTETAETASTSSHFRIEARYRYNVLNAPNSVSSVKAEMAMLLVENQEVSSGTSLDQFVTSLTQSLNTWHQAVKPSTVGASIQLDITLFASYGNAQLPVLQLFDVSIPVPSGWWPAPVI